MYPGVKGFCFASDLKSKINEMNLQDYMAYQYYVTSFDWNLQFS
jgi:hypothetical protein